MKMAMTIAATLLLVGAAAAQPQPASAATTPEATRGALALKAKRDTKPAAKKKTSKSKTAKAARRAQAPAGTAGRRSS